MQSTGTPLTISNYKRCNSIIIFAMKERKPVKQDEYHMSRMPRAMHLTGDRLSHIMIQMDMIGFHLFNHTRPLGNVSHPKNGHEVNELQVHFFSEIWQSQQHCYPASLFWYPWWRHQMETFSALMAICAGNSPVTDEFPLQRPVTRSVDVFFDLRLNKRLSKQSWGWWFETPSRPLWRHCNDRHQKCSPCQWRFRTNTTSEYGYHCTTRCRFLCV